MQPATKVAVQVAVVGPTVAGLCIARQLAERGVSVLLAGPRARPDAGLLHCGLSETPARLCDSLGAERFAELTAFARRSVGLVGAQRTGGLWVAVAPGEAGLMAPSARALQLAGVAARVVDAPELRARGVHAEVGFVVPDEGLAPGTTDALRLAAEAAGVTCLEADVRALGRDADGLTLDLGDVQAAAEIVVLADGLAAARLVDGLADRFVAVREQALWAEGRVDPVVGRAGHGYTWFRPWDGGVAVGGCRWATPHLEVGETVPEVVPAVQARIEAFARDRLGLGEVRGRWAWIDCHTCDGLPLVGPAPGDGRLVLCAGFCGNEWGLGPAAALAVVDGLLGGPTRTPSMFSPSRFVG